MAEEVWKHNKKQGHLGYKLLKGDPKFELPAIFKYHHRAALVNQLIISS